MKIIEARDGFINFEADESVYLSSFVQATGMDKTYIAQVNQMKQFGKIIIASARILFLYDGGTLVDYDRTLPSKDCELSSFPAEIMQSAIKASKPVIVGKTLDGKNNIFMDLSAFDKKTLISFDDNLAHNTLIRNLIKQFEHLGKNTVIIDTRGIINSKKYVAGKDFKLPLDTDTLEFMYKSCLNDATADSKATIAEVFKDLSEYSENVPFVPFDVLKSIVDEMVDKQHIFKLFVLKNRLANFDKLGYFASDKSDVDSLEKILESKNAFIDLSRLNPLFQNKFLDYIYSKIDSKNTQVILEVSNTISKKNLKNVIVDSMVPTIVASHSKFQYLNDIKDMFKNFIIEPTITNNELFKVYCTFLLTMKKGMCLIAGEGINYIPMVSKIEDINETMEALEASKETVDEKTIADSLEDELNSAENSEETLSQDEIITEIDEKSNDAIEAISENLEEPVEMELFSEEDNTVSQVGDTEVSDEVFDEVVENKAEEDIEETEENSEETLESVEELELKEDVIEPEYEEVSEIQEQESIEENIDLSDEEPMDIKSEEDSISLEEDDFEENSIDENVENEEESIVDTEIEPAEILSEDNSDDMLEYIAEEDDGSTSDLINLADESDYENLSQDEDVSIELSDDEELLIDEAESVSDNIEPEDVTQSDTDMSEPSIVPLDNEEYEQGLEETQTVDETGEDDIIIDITDDTDEIGIDEDVDRQIVEDVDKVFTTVKNEKDIEEISDSDLDLIDELNSDGEELEEYSGELEEISDSQIDDSILEQPSESIIPQRQHSQTSDNEILEKKEPNTPIVPVYDADIPQEDMVVSDSIQQGDSVIHAKYGNGVVEKMIKYGTKTLFSINFENIGRRLLDPTLTEIKKL